MMEGRVSYSIVAGEIVDKITTVGPDLAKTVFHLVYCGEQGKVVRRRSYHQTVAARQRKSGGALLIFLRVLGGVGFNGQD